MTGYACVIYYRRLLFKSFKNFVFIGLAPLIGALILTFIFFDAAFYYSNPVNSSNGKTTWFGFIKFDTHILGVHLYANGLGPPLVIGIGLLLVGIPIMLIWWAMRPAFFRHKREVAESLEASAPPLTPGAKVLVD